MRQALASVNNVSDLNCERLKRTYLECFAIHGNNTATWSEAVASLMALGYPRKTLVNWGVEAGYARKYVSEVLARILSRAGHRERKAGAGRKASREGQELLDHARQMYGDDHLKVLLAAWRTGKAQRPENKVSNDQHTELSLLQACAPGQEGRLLCIHNKEKKNAPEFLTQREIIRESIALPSGCLAVAASGGKGNT